MMGLAYDVVSKEEEAYKEFQAAILADPNYPGVHSSLGLIDWRLHKVAEAAAEFQKELKRYPNDPVSNYMMGKSYGVKINPRRRFPTFRRQLQPTRTTRPLF